MVERGGRKRDGWRDGRGWYRAGGKEGSFSQLAPPNINTVYSHIDYSNKVDS